MTKWIVLASLFLASPALAIDFTPTGSVLSVTYTEPTTNTDGSPLNDLSKTTINWRLCPTSGPCSSAYTLQDVPAALPTGGAAIARDVTVPIAPGQENNVEVFATATDLSGNRSADSLHVVKRVDRLSPAPPQ